MRIACMTPGVPEVFESLQGEGPSLGTPSVFIRASLCNLHCVWCDTDYTWNWEGTDFAHVRGVKYKRIEQKMELEPREIVELARRFRSRNVVLTGGEPLLQQSGWIEVMDGLRALDAAYRFEVETNGTLVPMEDFAARVAQWNVSPKLGNSGIRAELRERADAMEWFAGRGNFKFVIDWEGDIDEVLALAEKYGIAAGKIFLMPQGTTPEELDARAPWLAAACVKHGFRFSDRLHVRLWGSRRGV